MGETLAKCVSPLLCIKAAEGLICEMNNLRQRAIARYLLYIELYYESKELAAEMGGGYHDKRELADFAHNWTNTISAYLDEARNAIKRWSYEDENPQELIRKLTDLVDNPKSVDFVKNLPRAQGIRAMFVMISQLSMVDGEQNNLYLYRAAYRATVYLDDIMQQDDVGQEAKKQVILWLTDRFDLMPPGISWKEYRRQIGFRPLSWLRV